MFNLDGQANRVDSVRPTKLTGQPAGETSEETVMAKVLVIDDEPSIAHLVAEVIEEYGHEVTLAYNGRQGLELIKNNDFQLIISDVMMPYVNGRDLLMVIRADPKLTRTTFILMSAVAHLAQLDSKAKADAFVVKPFDISTIEKLVDTFLPSPEGSENGQSTLTMPNRAYSNQPASYQALS